MQNVFILFPEALHFLFMNFRVAFTVVVCIL